MISLESYLDGIQFKDINTTLNVKIADVADLDQAKNTEMFDYDYVTPATAC